MELLRKALNERLEKAKYTKRTGTPGNYKYEYGEKKGRSSKTKQTTKTKTQKGDELRNSSPNQELIKKYIFYKKKGFSVKSNITVEDIGENKFVVKATWKTVGGLQKEKEIISLDKIKNYTEKREKEIKQKKLIKEQLERKEIHNEEIEETVDTNSKEFKNWFGKSKIVGSNGKPLKVFHGTKKDFNSFKFKGSGVDRIGKDYGEAFYFTDNIKIARTYASNDYSMEYGGPDDVNKKVINAITNGYVKEPNAKIMGLYIKIENPMVIDAKGANHSEIYEEAVKEAKAKGHDGLIIKNIHDSASDYFNPDIDTYVVFSPSQIKSVKNNGNFSESDNLYKSEREGNETIGSLKKL